MSYSKMNTDMPTSLRSFSSNMNFNNRQMRSYKQAKETEDAGGNWVLNGQRSDTEKRLLKLRGTLNKLTSENYDDLVGDLKAGDLDADFINMIFDKAVSEQRFCSIYGRLCADLCNVQDGFKDMLTKRCSTLFEEALGFTNSNTKDKYFKFKENLIGFMAFVGELYLVKIYDDSDVAQFLDQLITNYTKETELMNCLLSMVKTVGKSYFQDKERTDKFFDRLSTMRASADTGMKDKFCIDDMCDLRTNDWQ